MQEIKISGKVAKLFGAEKILRSGVRKVVFLCEKSRCVGYFKICRVFCCYTWITILQVHASLYNQFLRLRNDALLLLQHYSQASLSYRLKNSLSDPPNGDFIFSPIYPFFLYFYFYLAKNKTRSRYYDYYYKFTLNFISRLVEIILFPSIVFIYALCI